MPLCPKCCSPLVKRNAPTKSYHCQRHGFVRKINSPPEYKGKDFVSPGLRQESVRSTRDILSSKSSFSININNLWDDIEMTEKETNVDDINASLIDQLPTSDCIDDMLCAGQFEKHPERPYYKAGLTLVHRKNIVGGV